MKPELLAPVSDFVSLAAAIDAGADSVYFGVKEFNMRANAKNFTLAELKKAVAICHKNKVNAYLTINTIIYEDELKKVKQVLRKAKQAGVDVVISWDMAVIQECKKLGITPHLSTQASVSNSESAKFFHKLGIKRIILARECSLEDIKKIKKENPGLEIEVFIHGAMCVSISGRCFISQHLFGRSANRGDCIQPCRREYIAVDKEEKHKLKIGTDYVMSPKDLCALPFIDKLIKAGIDCFKIEGRNRSPEYVKTVVESYKDAINADSEGNLTEELKKALVEKLKTVYNRGFSSGFFLGKPINEFADTYGSKATTRKKYIGIVLNFYKTPSVAEIKLEAGNLKIGDKIMIQGPTTGVKEQTISEMQIERKQVKKVKKGQRVGIKLDFLSRKNDKIYVVKNN